VIQLDNVTISVRGRTVLEGCTATFETGTVTHLTGANGSGKTTLIRAIAGIQRYSGSIRFDGTEAARVRDGLYVCFDDAPVFPFLSGYENVRMLLGRGMPRRLIAATAPAIADHALLRMTARKLSQGQRRRLHLIAALRSGARFLVLDEALNGVDAPTVVAVAAAIQEHARHATVLITGHHSETYAGLATRHVSLVGATTRSEEAA
jgi:ABC-type multidrug transport system ATPase subunit